MYVGKTFTQSKSAKQPTFDVRGGARRTSARGGRSPAASISRDASEWFRQNGMVSMTMASARLQDMLQVLQQLVSMRKESTHHTWHTYIRHKANRPVRPRQAIKHLS
jgi:hypothetical protein